MPTCTHCGAHFAQRRGTGRPWEKCAPCRGAEPPRRTPAPDRPPRILSCVEAEEKGDELAVIAASRWRLMVALDDLETPPSSLPGLSRELARLQERQQELELIASSNLLRHVIDDRWDPDAL